MLHHLQKLTSFFNLQMQFSNYVGLFLLFVCHLSLFANRTIAFTFLKKSHVLICGELLIYNHCKFKCYISQFVIIAPKQTKKNLTRIYQLRIFILLFYIYNITIFFFFFKITLKIVFDSVIL